MQKQIERIKARYFRPTISFPDGQITHHGGCSIYAINPVCICGLIHDLLPLGEEAEKIYPDFWKDDEKQAKTLLEEK